MDGSMVQRTTHRTPSLPARAAGVGGPAARPRAPWWALAAMVAASALAAGGCKRKAPPDLQVGVFLPLSGSDATFGTDARDGIQLAVDAINAAGGVQGKKVHAIFEDDGSSQAKASAAVRKLIEQDHVVGLLGETASFRTIAGAEVANRLKVPLIAPTSTAAEVTRGDYVFRTCFTDAQQGAVAAQFAREFAGKKKAAILFMEDDQYSTGLAQSFKESFTRLGGTVVAEKGYRKSEQSFAPYLAELNVAAPEVFFIPVYYGDMVRIAQQARLLKIPTDAFLGGDGWDSTALLEGAPTELEGAHFTNHYAPDVPWDEAKSFEAAFQRKFGREPTSLAAQGYDASRVLDAMARATDGTPLPSGTPSRTHGISGGDRHPHHRRRAQRQQTGGRRPDQNRKFTYVTQMLSL